MSGATAHSSIRDRHTRRRFLLAFTPAVLSLTACATPFASTWISTAAERVHVRGRKVAVLFISTDDALRQEMESVMAASLTSQGAIGVTSQSLLAGADLRNLAQLQSRLAQEQIDAVMALRVLRQNRRSRIRQSAAPINLTRQYLHFTQYWNFGWEAPFVPGPLLPDTILRIEVLTFELSKDVMLWAGTSKPVDPSHLKLTVHEVSDAAAEKLARKNLIRTASDQ